MGKGANAAVQAEMKALETRPVYLYQAQLDDGTVLRYAGRTSGSVNFAGHVWLASGITHTPIEVAQDSRIAETTLTIPIVADKLAAYIAAGGRLNGLSVDIFKVFLDALDDPLNYVPEFSGETDAPEYNEKTMSVRVRQNQGTFARVVPGLFYMPQCQWKFGPELPCGYTGPDTTCDHTPAACDAKGNTDNFGGCRWQAQLSGKERGNPRRNEVTGKYEHVV